MLHVPAFVRPVDIRKFG